MPHKWKLAVSEIVQFDFSDCKSEPTTTITVYSAVCFRCYIYQTCFQITFTASARQINLSKENEYLSQPKIN